MIPKDPEIHPPNNNPIYLPIYIIQAVTHVHHSGAMCLYYNIALVAMCVCVYIIYIYIYIIVFMFIFIFIY